MTTATQAPPAVLTIYEAAEFLRVSTRTLYGMTAPRGPIPCLRVGPRGVRYTMAALQRFIEDQEGRCTENRSAAGDSGETNGK